MRNSLLLLAALIWAGAGCDRHSRGGVLMGEPAPSPIRLAVPDRTFRLTEEERATIGTGFDIEALERLLQMATPEFRRQLLPYFQVSALREGRGMLTTILDPELQAVLEEVYVPAWDKLSDWFLNDPGQVMPGRLLARERREARKRAEQSRSPE